MASMFSNFGLVKRVFYYTAFVKRAMVHYKLTYLVDPHL